MARHIVVTIFMHLIGGLVLKAFGLDYAAIFVVSLTAIAMLSCGLAVLMHFHRGNRTTVKKVSDAQSAFWATANLIQALRPERREAVAAVYEAIENSKAVQTALTRATSTRISLFGRFTRRNKKRATIETCDQVMPGARLLLHAMLSHTELPPDDFNLLVGPWVREGLPLYCPRPRHA